MAQETPAYARATRGTRTPGVWIYNPDDEPDGAVMYSGHQFTFAPNTATRLEKPEPVYDENDEDLLIRRGWEDERDGKWDASVVAAHVLAHLGQWGVCVVSGPVEKGHASNPGDQAAVDAAEQVYLHRTTEWAAELMQQYADRIAPFTVHEMIGPQRNADEQKAFDWWKANKKRVEQSK